MEEVGYWWWVLGCNIIPGHLLLCPLLSSSPLYEWISSGTCSCCYNVLIKYMGPSGHDPIPLKL